MDNILGDISQLDFEGIMKMKSQARDLQVREVRSSAPADLEHSSQNVKAAIRGSSLPRRQRLASLLAG